MRDCSLSQQAKKSAEAKIAYKALLPANKCLSLLLMISLLPANFVFPQSAQAQTVINSTTTGYQLGSAGYWIIKSGSVVSNSGSYAIQIPIGNGGGYIPESITNNGRIVATDGIAISLLSSAAVTVNNVKGASLNADDATISGLHGIYIGGSEMATILNDKGTISGSSTDGIFLNNFGGSNVKNKAGSTISSDRGAGISSPSSLTLTNDGTIISNNRYGVYAPGGLTGTNSGSITSNQDYGVLYGGAGSTFSNSGSISGTAAGVWFTSGTSLTNSGTITGGLGGTAIVMGGTGQTLILDTGTRLNGNVVNNTDNTNFLKLQGTGALPTGTSNMTGFQSLTMSGSSWTLGGIVSISGTTAAATLVQTGTLIIGGTLTNGVGGGSTVNAGAILQIGDNGASGSVAGDITNNGTVAFKRTDGGVAVSNNISGSGVVSQIGSGTTILTGTNSYAGGTNINAGTLQVDSDARLGNASGALSFNGGTLTNSAAFTTTRGTTIGTGGGTFNNTGTNDLTISGVMTGSGQLTKSGSGKLILTANNSLTGSATINGGTLQLGTGGNSGDFGGAGNISTITNNGTLAINRSDTVVLANKLTGSGNLNKDGVGTLVLTGDNSYAGITNINAGTLQIGDGGISGSLGLSNTVNFANNTTKLVFTRSGNFKIDAELVGSGSLQRKIGGTTVLTNNNARFSGSTTIDVGGNLQLGNGGTTGALGGTINTSAINNLGTLTINRLDKIVLANNISGSGSLAQGVVGGPAGAILVLNGTNNTYTGTTTVNSGTLQIGDGVTDGTLGKGAVVVNAGANLVFNRTAASTLTLDPANAISGAGTIKQRQGTTIIASNNASFTGSITIDGGAKLQLGTGGMTGDLGGAGNRSLITNDGTLVINRSDAVTLANKLTGSGNLNQDGAGTLILTGDNDYSGITNINAGTLQIGDGGISGSLGSSNTVSFADNTTKLVFTRSGKFTINAELVGSGSIQRKAGGTTVLTSNNANFNGSTTIEAGGNLQLGDGGTTGGLGGSINTSAINNLGTLTIDRLDTIVLANNISGSGSLAQGVVDGPASAILVLNGTNNTYTGTTTVNSGTLQIGDGTTLNAGTLGKGAVVVNAGSNLVFNRLATSADLTIDGSISGAGTLTQQTSKTILTDNNAGFTGTSNISSGATLQLGVGGLSGNLGGTGDINNNGDLAVNRSDTVIFTNVIKGSGNLNQNGSGTTVLARNNSYTGNTNITTGTLQVGDGVNDSGTLGSGSSGVVSVSSGATLAFNRIGTFTLDANLTGSGSLLQKTGGTTILTSNNADFNGSATIDPGGTLQLGNGGATGGLGGIINTSAITNHGTLAINHSGTVTLNHDISGTGAITQGAVGGPSSAVLMLTGTNNNYTGLTTVSSGTLQIGDGTTPNAGTLGKGAVVVNAGSNLVFNRAAGSSDLIVSNDISGSGILSHDGTGTTVLTHDNDGFSGSTIINAGTVQIGDGGTTGSITGNITNNGTLAINRSDENFDFNGTITGTGTVRHIGLGKTSLVGTNDYRGTTFVDFGTLAAGTLNSFSPHSNHNIADGATLDLNGYSQTVASLNHAGTIKLSTAVSASPPAPAFSPPAPAEDFSFAPLMMDSPSFAPAGPTVGTSLTVTGDYIGNGGTIIFNTMLGGDDSPTDRLNIAGNSSGSALVKVNNVGGAGSATVEGIKLIDVAGNSGASFSLVSDYLFEGQPSVIAGAYSYRLYQNGVSTPTDGDWYLRSTITDPTTPTTGPTTPTTGPTTPTTGPTTPTITKPTTTGPVYQPGAPLYEASAQVALDSNDGLLPRLRGRVGDRYDNDTTDNHHAGTHKNTTNLWALMESSHARISPNSSTTGTHYDSDKWRLQVGTDGRLYEGTQGKLYGGIMGHFGTASADTKSLYGRGTVDLSAYGVGASLTWMGQDDFYIDAQAHWSWYSSDIKSHSLGRTVTKNNHGHGYGMSLEVGQKIALNGDWEITPQAQLSYSEVYFDKFTDPYGASVVLNHAQTLRGRLGTEFGRSAVWKERNGAMSRSRIYGLANLTYDFRNGSQVSVSNVALKTHNDRLWAELGMGGSYRWNDDQYSLSGEVGVKSSLNNFAKSYELHAKIIFSIAW